VLLLSPSYPCHPVALCWRDVDALALFHTSDACPGEVATVSSSTRVEKSAGNEFKVYGLVGSGGDSKEYHLRAGSSSLRDLWIENIARETCGARPVEGDGDDASISSGRYVVRRDIQMFACSLLLPHSLILIRCEFDAASVACGQQRGVVVMVLDDATAPNAIPARGDTGSQAVLQLRHPSGDVPRMSRDV
jgi:hypothetical protein